MHNYYIWSTRLFSYKSLPLLGFEPFTCGFIRRQRLYLKTLSYDLKKPSVDSFEEFFSLFPLLPIFLDTFLFFTMKMSRKSVSSIGSYSVKVSCTEVFQKLRNDIFTSLVILSSSYFSKLRLDLWYPCYLTYGLIDPMMILKNRRIIRQSFLHLNIPKIEK